MSRRPNYSHADCRVILFSYHNRSNRRIGFQWRTMGCCQFQPSKASDSSNWWLISAKTSSWTTLSRTVNILFGWLPRVIQVSFSWMPWYTVFMFNFTQLNFKIRHRSVFKKNQTLQCFTKGASFLLYLLILKFIDKMRICILLWNKVGIICLIRKLVVLENHFDVSQLGVKYISNLYQLPLCQTK